MYFLFWKSWRGRKEKISKEGKKVTNSRLLVFEGKFEIWKFWEKEAEFEEEGEGEKEFEREFEFEGEGVG